MANGNGTVTVPRWVIVAIGFLLATAITSMVAWAVNIDTTQRSLLIDVSELKEYKLHVKEQLNRIEEDGKRTEDKIDAVLERLKK